MGVRLSNIFRLASSVCFVCLFFLTACQPRNQNKEDIEEPMPNTPTSSSLVFNSSSSISLDGDWRFSIDRQDEGESESWFAPSFDDSAWQIVDVPHTWSVMPEYSLYNGLAWYRYEITLPQELQDMLFRLRFQAVFYLARIWVNGDYVGEHEGGYTPFEFNVSSFLKPGLKNVVAVLVDNKISPARIPAQLSGSWTFDWWNYGGIVRSVSIEATNPVYISRQRIVAKPELTGIDEATAAYIASSVAIENTSENRFDGQVFFTISKDGTAQIVFNSQEGEPVSIAPGQSAEIQFSTKIENPELWHFDHPNLYVLAITLKENGQDVHHLESIFGIRQIELKHNQIWLNGEPVRLVGVTRHADSPQFGLAETVQIMAADYNEIKKLND